MSDRDAPAMRAYVSGRLLLRIVVGVEHSYACGLVVVATPGSRVSKARPVVQIVLVFRTGECHRLCCATVLRCEGQARGAGRKIALRVARGRNRHICRGLRRQCDRKCRGTAFVYLQMPLTEHEVRRVRDLIAGNGGGVRYVLPRERDRWWPASSRNSPAASLAKMLLYATCTVCPWATGVAKVNVRVFPETSAAVSSPCSSSSTRTSTTAR